MNVLECAPTRTQGYTQPFNYQNPRADATCVCMGLSHSFVYEDGEGVRCETERVFRGKKYLVWSEPCWEMVEEGAQRCMGYQSGWHKKADPSGTRTQQRKVGHSAQPLGDDEHHH